MRRLLRSAIPAYFATGVAVSPRNFSIGPMLGCAPSHASCIFSRFPALPRESAMQTKRSPLARFMLHAPSAANEGDLA